MLSPRQELVLRKVVESDAATVAPVGSKTLAVDPEIEAGPFTVRNELAILEEQGVLAHPHTSPGRTPTDAGHRWYVAHLTRADRPGPVVHADRPLDVHPMLHAVDEAMRVTS